jgi:hypothetical protein
LIFKRKCHLILAFYGGIFEKNGVLAKEGWFVDRIKETLFFFGLVVPLQGE